VAFVGLCWAATSAASIALRFLGRLATVDAAVAVADVTSAAAINVVATALDGLASVVVKMTSSFVLALDVVVWLDVDPFHVDAHVLNAARQHSVCSFLISAL